LRRELARDPGASCRLYYSEGNGNVYLPAAKKSAPVLASQHGGAFYLIRIGGAL